MHTQIVLQRILFALSQLASFIPESSLYTINNAYLLLKAFVARFAASSEFEMNELVNEETSIEASILHELQGAMVQVI